MEVGSCARLFSVVPLDAMAGGRVLTLWTSECLSVVFATLCLLLAVGGHVVAASPPKASSAARSALRELAGLELLLMSDYGVADGVWVVRAFVLAMGTSARLHSRACVCA